MRGLGSLVSTNQKHHLSLLLNLHPPCPICKTLGKKNHGNAYRCIDRTHREWVDDTQTLDEDSAIDRGKVLTSELEENIDADYNQRSL